MWRPKLCRLCVSCEAHNFKTLTVYSEIDGKSMQRDKPHNWVKAFLKAESLFSIAPMLSVNAATSYQYIQGVPYLHENH